MVLDAPWENEQNNWNDYALNPIKSILSVYGILTATPAIRLHSKFHTSYTSEQQLNTAATLGLSS